MCNLLNKRERSHFMRRLETKRPLIPNFNYLVGEHSYECIYLLGGLLDLFKQEVNIMNDQIVSGGTVTSFFYLFYWLE